MVQCVIITMGPTRVLESSPYGSNHIIFTPKMDCYPCMLDYSCEHFSCKIELCSRDLANDVSYILKNQGRNLFKHNQQDFLFKNYSVYLTKINKDHFFLESITPKTTRFHLQQIYYVLWNFILFDKDVTLSHETFSINLTSYFTLIEKLLTYIELNLSQLVQMNTLEQIVSHETHFFQDIIQLKENFPYLYPILNFYYVQFMNLQGKGLEQIKMNINDILINLENALLLFIDLTQKKQMNKEYNELYIQSSEH